MLAKLRRQLLPVFTLAKIDIRRAFRDKVALFFIFAFPLIFLFVFGGIFSGEDKVSFKVGLLNQSQSAFSQKFVEELNKNETFDIDKEVVSQETADLKMGRDEIDATIVLPEGFGDTNGKPYPNGEAKILYNANNESAGQTLGTVLEGVFDGINSQLVKTDTPFIVKTESTKQEGSTRFDYTFAGLLGFSVIGLGIFGPTTVFPKLKQNGVLRRYHTTTLKVWQYFLGNVISTATVGLMSVAVMFTVALTIFDLNMRGDYVSFALFMMISTGVIFGIGLAVGGWAKNENQAQPLTNLLTFPMIFLSGTFFPRFLMPEWLQNVSAALPLTPVIDGARLIVTEGKTIFEVGPQIGLLAIWGVVIYIVAFKAFRWE